MTKINNEELRTEQFATLTALKGNQFGKQIFSTLIKFSELKNFLEVFPEVQRSVNHRKVKSIKTYILSGVELDGVRFFNGLTVSTRGFIYYDDEAKRIAIDTKNSRLSVNDGQHRLLGANEAINDLKARIKVANLMNVESETLKARLEKLENMYLPVVIFNNLTVEEEKQLFTDINELLTKPTKSEKIRLSQSDIFSRMAREIAENNKFLEIYGVEYAKSSIGPKNENAVLLTTIYDWVVTYAKAKYGRKKGLSDENYEECKAEVIVLVDEMFENLPKDLNVKGKYILSKGFTLRAIFEFIVKGSNEGIDIDCLYEAIKNTDWSETLEAWGKYGAQHLERGSLLFPGSDAGGKRSVLKELNEQLLALNELVETV